ncbi:MAG: phage holin [Firmicutes bacterium]|nr:phage holin [Bacillota bacterium]MDY5676262.1 phage holin [Eubacteriales bacterium]
MKKKIKTTSFWLTLSGAVVMLLDTISNIIGLDLYSKKVESIILAICTFLVMTGVITKKDVSDPEPKNSDELLDDINDEINKDK